MRRAGCIVLFPACFLICLNEGLGGLVLGVLAPVGLHEDGVDLLDADGFCLVANGFDEGSDGEITDGAQDAFGDANEERDGFFTEGIVRESGLVKLIVEVGFDGVGSEQVEAGGVGDAAFNVEVVAELEGGVEGGLADEDEVMVFWKVF